MGDELNGDRGVPEQSASEHVEQIAEVVPDKPPIGDSGSREFQEAVTPVASTGILNEVLNLKPEASGPSKPSNPPPPPGSNTALPVHA